MWNFKEIYSVLLGNNGKITIESYDNGKYSKKVYTMNEIKELAEKENNKRTGEREININSIADEAFNEYAANILNKAIDLVTTICPETCTDSRIIRLVDYLADESAAAMRSYEEYESEDNIFMF